ncbi:MAG: PAS domain-containing protein [Halobacteriales archaeon]|nr:PAS domain-containing protein [Halobacteriales archaeon]
MAGLPDDIVVNLAASVIASAVLLAGGFFWGKMAERRRTGRNLESYDFYPFKVDADGMPAFDLEAFQRGVRHFLKDRDYKAARQLVFLGEQHQVRGRLDGAGRAAYERLFEKYDGGSVVSDMQEFLENYSRLVRLLGESFPNQGIEILLHNLADPGHSLVALENNVTGRRLGDGTTNLLVDLKRRQRNQQDKLNYELVIGARRFKCTTIPILRRDYGVVGAVCVNVDVNYLREEVMPHPERVAAFFRDFCHTDQRLDENILSKDEYAKALAGKRHFREHAAG